MFGPFDVTSQAVWSSSNTAVITVGPVTTAGCQVSCLSAGTANAHADFDGISSILDITSGVCEGTFIPFPADCPFDVKHSCTIRDSSSMVGEIFTDCSEQKTMTAEFTIEDVPLAASPIATVSMCGVNISPNVQFFGNPTTKVVTSTVGSQLIVTAVVTFKILSPGKWITLNITCGARCEDGTTQVASHTAAFECKQ